MIDFAIKEYVQKTNGLTWFKTLLILFQIIVYKIFYRLYFQVKYNNYKVNKCEIKIK